MTRSIALRCCTGLLATWLVLSACSDAERTQSAEPAPPAQLSEQQSSEAVESAPASEQTDGISRSDGQQVSPTTWRGVHPNSAGGVYSLSGSTVVTTTFSDVVVWDVDNFVGGEQINLYKGLGIDGRSDPVLFSDQLLVVKIKEGDRDAHVVFDLKADDVAASRVDPPLSTGAWLIGVAGDYLLFSIKNSDRFELWNANDLSAPAHTLERSASWTLPMLTEDGEVVFVDDDGQVFTWQPPQALELVGDVNGELDSPVGDIAMVDGDRLFLIDDPRINIWNRVTGESIQLDGFKLDATGRGHLIEHLAVLADGRIVAGSPATDTMIYWDLSQPSEPTVVRFTEDRQLDSFAVLPDGRILLSFGQRLPGHVTCCSGSEFELITPPPPT